MARVKKEPNGSRDIFFFMLARDAERYLHSPRLWVNHSTMLKMILDGVDKHDAGVIQILPSSHKELVVAYLNEMKGEKMNMLARKKANQNLEMRLWAMNYFNYKKYTSRKLVSRKMVAPIILRMLEDAFGDRDMPTIRTITDNWLKNI